MNLLKGEITKGECILDENNSGKKKKIRWHTTFGTELRHSCIRCGHSCRNNDIYLFPADQKRLLNDEPLQGDMQISLLPLTSTGDCPHLTQTEELTWECSKYDKRPGVCREYPFKAVFHKGIWFIDTTISCTSILRKSGSPFSDAEAIKIIKSTLERVPEIMNWDQNAIDDNIWKLLRKIGNSTPHGKSFQDLGGFSDKIAIEKVGKTYENAISSGMAPYRHPADKGFTVYLPGQNHINVVEEEYGLIKKIKVESPKSMTGEACNATRTYIRYCLSRAIFAMDITQAVKHFGINEEKLIRESQKKILMMLCYFSNMIASAKRKKQITEQDIIDAGFMIDNSIMTPAEEIVKCMKHKKHN